MCVLQELSVMRQVVVGLMSGQGQEGGDKRLQGGGASSGSPAVAPTRNMQDMPTPTVFVSAPILQPPAGQYVYIHTCSVYSACGLVYTVSV